MSYAAGETKYTSITIRGKEYKVIFYDHPSNKVPNTSSYHLRRGRAFWSAMRTNNPDIMFITQVYNRKKYYPLPGISLTDKNGVLEVFEDKE